MLLVQLLLSKFRMSDICYRIQTLLNTLGTFERGGFNVWKDGLEREKYGLKMLRLRIMTLRFVDHEIYL